MKIAIKAILSGGEHKTKEATLEWLGHFAQHITATTGCSVTFLTDTYTDLEVEDDHANQ